MYRHRYKYIVVLWDPLWVFETVVFQNDFGEDFGVFLGKIQDAGLFETSHRHNHKSLGVLKKSVSGGATRWVPTVPTIPTSSKWSYGGPKGKGHKKSQANFEKCFLYRDS